MNPPEARVTLRDIHQEALDKIAVLSRTPHAAYEEMEAVINLHNRRVNAACAILGVTDCSRLTNRMWRQPFRLGELDEVAATQSDKLNPKQPTL